MRGALVVLEGGEGVGKTTQLTRLAARVRRAGFTVVIVREPGGTPLGDDVRRLLLTAPHAIVPRAEALLFMASRAQLVEDVMRPAIDGGHVVLADRFFLSTYAYQSVGRGLDEAAVRSTNTFATGGLVPDVTLLMDLPLGHGLARATSRAEPDRLERSGDAFHQRVALAFRDFAAPDWQARHPECGPIELVNAAGSESEVEARLWERLLQRLPETFSAAYGSQTGI